MTKHVSSSYINWPQICIPAGQIIRMRKLLLLPLLLFSVFSFSQVHVGLFGGIANYQGDLINNAYVGRLTRPAVGITGSYEVTRRVALRAGFTYAQIAGNDRFNTRGDLIQRNLSFESDILEFSLVGEFHTFEFDTKKWSPYVFGGLAVYHFDPYVLSTDREKIYLKPLSTEGQGLTGYPESKPYALTQLALPFGAGIRYAINDNIRLGAELGLRKLFTDYLDDVSTNYADQNDLITERGELAAAIAYRGDEVQGGNPNYPAKGAKRGTADQKDWYYLTGLTLSFRLGNGPLLGGGGGKVRSGYGCPKVP